MVLRKSVHALTLACLGLLTGCTPSKWSEKSNSLEVISVNSESATEMKASEIYHSQKLIKLKTDSTSLMGDVLKVHSTNDRYFILCSNGIYVFDTTGMLLDKIKEPGQNENQYLKLSDMHVDASNQHIEIYDSKQRKFIQYDFNGKYKGSYPSILDGYSTEKLNDEIHAIYIGASYYNDDVNHKLNFVSRDGNILKSYIPITEHETKFMHFGDLNNFSKWSGGISFGYSFNDTIYDVASLEIRPKYVVDFGNKKLPSTYLEASYSDVRHFYESVKTTGYALRFNGFLESDDYLLFGYNEGDAIYHCLYSKRSKKLKNIRQVINDLTFDGAREQLNYGNLPKLLTNDHNISVLDSHQFKSLVDGLRKTSSPQQWESYKAKHPDIVGLYDNITITDNPILVVNKIKAF